MTHYRATVNLVGLMIVELVCLVVFVLGPLYLAASNSNPSPAIAWGMPVAGALLFLGVTWFVIFRMVFWLDVYANPDGGHLVQWRTIAQRGTFQVAEISKWENKGKQVVLLQTSTRRRPLRISASSELSEFLRYVETLRS